MYFYLSSNMNNRFAQLRNIHGIKLILSLVFIFIAGVFFLLGYVQTLQVKIVQTAALESAKLYSDALREFRTIYTSEVVERIRSHPDISVSHDYSKLKYAIPLPATLSMKLGEHIGSHLKGAETYLYSPFPFPWRTEEGGLKDDFQNDAWQFLRANPEAYYFKFVTYKGRKVLRYATSDIMRPGCVNCHNDHSQTPKSNWKVGDVRGVLEIIHPLEKVNEQNEEGKRGLIILTVILILTVLLCLIILVYKFQRNTRDLENIVRDRTAQVKETEKKLNTAKKMAAIGEISSGIAHEINQPLAAMKITSTSLRKSIEAAKTTRAYEQLSRIEGQVERIDTIIRQLNTHNADIGSQAHEVVEIQEVVNAAVNQSKPAIEQNECELEVNMPNESILIMADVLELQRVVINLITNSLHALELNKNKKICLNVIAHDNSVCIDIEDNGSGIPAEIQDKIFDPFYTTKEVGKGTGLGLSLCYGIIKKHEGTIKVDASYKLGARISITLPIHSKR